MYIQPDRPEPTTPCLPPHVAVARPRAAAAPCTEWKTARNILAIRLDGMGDVLMSSPALAAVRHSRPDIRLTLLTSPAGAQAGRRIDVVDDMLVYAAPWVGPASAAGTARTDLDFIAALAARRFDAAIIFTVCTQSALPAALACRLAGIPLRLAHARENPYALLTDWIPERDLHLAQARHEVQRQLDLVRHVGYPATDERLRLCYDEADLRATRQMLASAGIQPTEPYIVVHPGASAPSRRYPPERYGIAADLLQVATGWRVVFTGSADESDIVARAAAQMRPAPVDLAGQLDVGQLAALISGARVLLCNNTGPAHMAAALGTPVVVLYALTNPQHTPWRVPAHVLSHDVPCRNCLQSQCHQGHHDCLMQVAPVAVAKAAMALTSPRDTVG